MSTPDAPDLTRAFGYAVSQRRGCGGFPVAEVIALFHAGTGLLQWGRRSVSSGGVAVRHHQMHNCVSLMWHLVGVRSKALSKKMK